MTTWPSVALKDCCEIVSGSTPSTAVAEYWSGSIPWVTPKDLGDLDSRCIADTARKLTNRGLRASGARLLPVGSVLFSSRAPIGYVAINTVPMATNQGFKSMIPRADCLEPRYLYWWLLTNRLYLQSLGTGATFKELSAKAVGTIRIPRPTLTEQRRIADVLDKADTLRRARHSTLASLSELVIAAFGVHFTPAELTDRVPLARAFAIPPNYGTMIPPAETGGFVSLRVKSIQNGSLDLSDNKYVDLPLKDRPRHSVQDGDLLMARAIGSLEHLGKCVVVYPGDAQWAFDSHLMRIRLDRTVMLPEYLRVWLLTPGGRAAFLRIARRSAVQYNVNTKEIAAFLVPMPPIAKQQAFVDHLRAIVAEQQLMASSLAHLDGLFGSLQYRGFAGEL